MSNLWTNLVNGPNWIQKISRLAPITANKPVIHLKHKTKYFWYLLTLHCIFHHHQCSGGNPIASEIHASFYPFHPMHSSTRSCEGLKQRYILFVLHLSQSIRWQAFHKYHWRIITFPCLAILMGGQTCQCLVITFQRTALVYCNWPWKLHFRFHCDITQLLANTFICATQCFQNAALLQ